MSDSTWICTNNPWHDWDGLTCRWCDATRTAGEAIVSGLASRRGGSEDAAQALVDAHRAEQWREEAARLLEGAACDADWGKTPDFCAGLRAGAELLLANTREKATAEAATATPDFFTAGRTYTSIGPFGLHLRFECEHITRDPKNGDREAWGWLHRSDGTRRMDRMWDRDYPKWTVEGGDGRG